MAERKSVNKYYPPDWDPSKGSVNKYVGQHPLRDRAKKLSQGILVIRFEMPYNIWCGGCNSHIGMGVRYNAEKSKVGNYYSTPIYKFRMKCHLCDNYFEIQTDPKNHDYVILEGARRKEQRWDPKENEQIVPEDKATQKKMATDAMFKLEHGSDDVKRGQKAISNLGSLESRRDEWKDDYMLNKMARQKFRDEKKSLKAVEAADSALLTKSSLDIPLAAEREEDVKLAGLMKYRTLESFDEKQAQKRQAIESRSLFPDSKKLKTDNGSKEDHKLDILRKHVNKARAIKAGGGPFDRMAMNSLNTRLSNTQNSLGIRRKSKDNGVAAETVVSNNDDEPPSECCTRQDKKFMNSDMEKKSNIDCGSKEEQNTNPGDNCNKNVSDSVNVSCGSKTLINGKESDNFQESSISRNGNKSDIDKAKSDSSVTSVSVTSGLSLVSNYCDSDTDSSTT